MSTVLKEQMFVKEAEMKKTKNGDNYYELFLQKKELLKEARIWSKFITDEKIEKGVLLNFEGIVDMYQEKENLVIHQYKVIKKGDFDPKEYIKSAPLTEEEMKEKLEKIIDNIETPVLKFIVQDIVERIEPVLYQYPAAERIHHAFHGGLAFHILSMCEIANTVIHIYPDKINKDLLISGIILHDLGKTKEFHYEGYTVEYDTEAQLIGHVIYAPLWVQQSVIKYIERLKKEEKRYTKEERLIVDKLMHLILSHHGKKEWGAPVEPRILEAFILHHIDLLDAKTNQVITGLDNVIEGTTDWVRGLGPLSNI